MATKRIRCPYCSKMFEREDLPHHLELKHEDELPDEFTPLRVAFHLANRKDFNYTRSCKICGRPTPWNEKKGRYDQLCGDPKCKEAQTKKMRDGFGDKDGKYRPTATPDGLEKMLAHRKISGEYKYSDGTIFTYTGSYEKKALEFMDKILELQSEDIQMPGPILEYNLDGQKHYYIPDIYYIPYNLIIEVKDGGDRPNKNQQWKETRRKQLAKEEFIIKHTDYNYIRLTNNDFSQLIAVFADLKLQLVENTGKKVVHVNENMIGAIQAAFPVAGANDVIMVRHMQNNVFAGKRKFAVSNSPTLSELWGETPEGVFGKMSRNEIINSTYETFLIKGKRKAVSEFFLKHEGEYANFDLFYEEVFGHPCYTESQLLYEEGVEPYTCFYKQIGEIINTVAETCLVSNRSALMQQITNEAVDISIIEQNIEKGIMGGVIHG